VKSLTKGLRKKWLPEKYPVSRGGFGGAKGSQNGSARQPKNERTVARGDRVVETERATGKEPLQTRKTGGGTTQKEIQQRRVAPEPKGFTVREGTNLVHDEEVLISSLRNGKEP